jgi:hypothetical protein
VVPGLNVLKQPLKAASLSLLGSYLLDTLGIFIGIAISYAFTGFAARAVLLKEVRHYGK